MGNSNRTKENVRFEIWIDKSGRHWIISSHSISYERVTADKKYLQGFDTRYDTFKYLEESGVRSFRDDKDNGYYEIYV